MSFSSADFFQLYYVRYLACAGITFILWDSLLTLPIELRHIWNKSSPRLLQVAFILNRYGTAMGVSIFIIHSMSLTELSDSMCQRSAVAIALLICVSDITGNALTIFRVFMIWDRRARILKLLLIGMFISSGCSIAFAILIVEREFPSILWSTQIKSCLMTKSSVLFVALYLPQAVFDIYAALLVLFNSVTIPRTSGDSLWKMLHEDGIILIGMAFLLRITDIVINIQGSAILYLVTLTFVPSLISVLNTRMVLTVYEARRKRAEVLASKDNELIEIDLRSNAGDAWSHTSG